MIQKPNYTQIPNVYFDSIMQELNGSENLVFLAIMRKTFGWRKKKDRISYSQIMKMTGLAKSTTATAIKSLELKDLIVSEKKGQSVSYFVNVTDITVPKIEPVRKSNCTENRTGTVPKIEPVEEKTVPKIGHTKESNIKKLSKEIYIKIDEAYIDAYKELKKQDPKIFYPAVRKRQKILLENGFTQDDIVLAIQEGKKDRWLVGNGFDFLTLLSEKILPRLVNQARASSPQEKKEAPKCPKCGKELSALFCDNCMIQYNSKLEEL